MVRTAMQLCGVCKEYRSATAATCALNLGMIVGRQGLDWPKGLVADSGCRHQCVSCRGTDQAVILLPFATTLMPIGCHAGTLVPDFCLGSVC